jgi:hypothetical protein
MSNNYDFNNISVISWRSVVLVGETAVPGENHRIEYTSLIRVETGIYEYDNNIMFILGYIIDLSEWYGAVVVVNIC